MLRKGLTRDLLILFGFLVDEASAWTFNNQMRQILFDGWYKRSSFSPTISRLLSVGEIEKREKGGKVFYRLTSRGSEKLKENIPIFKLAREKWDGRWRIVIFDIPEKMRRIREALRRKLLSLGFGRWQRSVYINPHDIQDEINQYLYAKRLFPSCVCLTAKRNDMGADKVLANRIWRLDKLNEEYEEFIFSCHGLKEESLTEVKKREKLRKLWQRYKELILRDPHLPKELLPKGWLAEKARRELSSFWD